MTKGRTTMYGVTITELIQKMNLKNIIPEIDTDKVVLTHPDVNRPALQLAGFFDHFDKERVQIIGFVEQEYIKTLSRERKVEKESIYDGSYEVPYERLEPIAVTKENMDEEITGKYHEESDIYLNIRNK